MIGDSVEVILIGIGFEEWFFFQFFFILVFEFVFSFYFLFSCFLVFVGYLEFKLWLGERKLCFVKYGVFVYDFSYFGDGSRRVS